MVVHGLFTLLAPMMAYMAYKRIEKARDSGLALAILDQMTEQYE